MSACRALGSLTGLLDDAPALVKLAGQNDGRSAISRVSKGTPSTNVGSVTGLLDDAPALVQLAGQDDGSLTVYKPASHLSVFLSGQPSTVIGQKYNNSTGCLQSLRLLRQPAA